MSSHIPRISEHFRQRELRVEDRVAIKIRRFRMKQSFQLIHRWPVIERKNLSDSFCPSIAGFNARNTSDSNARSISSWCDRNRAAYFRVKLGLMWEQSCRDGYHIIHAVMDIMSFSFIYFEKAPIKLLRCVKRSSEAWKHMEVSLWSL